MVLPGVVDCLLDALRLRPYSVKVVAPVWSFLSSVVLLYLQPTLLKALAKRMAWPTATQPTPPTTIHFTGFSAGSYTAIALETEYRLLSHRFQQPLCPGCATLGALGCPLIYLLALLQPHFLAIPSRPQAALGLDGSPKRCVQCPMGIRSARQPLLPQELHASPRADTAH